MHDTSEIVARPQAAKQLVLLFHGVGASAADLVPLGKAVAQARPDAWVVSVEGPHASTLGRGREWFSVIGITELDRPQRIAQAMPLFLEAVKHWQQESGIGPENTVLVGFSQGAIMSLESTLADLDKPAAERVIAIAGRFADTVRAAPRHVQFHFVHGEQDGVVAPRFSVEAAQALQGLGGQATVDLLPGLGHGIDARALEIVLTHLR